MNDQMKWSSARLWDMPCYFPLPMALVLATARFYCMNVGHRSEALNGPHSCGRGPGVGWRKIALSLRTEVNARFAWLQQLSRFRGEEMKAVLREQRRLDIYSG